MLLLRLGLGLLSLLLISMLVFFVVSLLPGDFATEILGQSATSASVAQFRSQLGLDQPAVTRYLLWLGGLLRGDLGYSFASQAGDMRPVAAIIGGRLLNTLFLAGITAILAVPLAIGLGIVAALYRGTWVDRLINGTTLITISCPEYFVAYILMLFLAIRLPLFYSIANLDAGPLSLATLDRIALPVLTLTLVIVAHMMRMTRAAIVGVLAQPYIEMAACKGLSQARIVVRHALPNAWAPIANVVAFNLSYLIVGVVVVEVVFVYPGIGQTMVDAVRARDVPVVQACAMIFGATYVLLNLVADMIAIGTNPRLHPR